MRSSHLPQKWSKQVPSAPLRRRTLGFRKRTRRKGRKRETNGTTGDGGRDWSHGPQVHRRLQRSNKLLLPKSRQNRTKGSGLLPARIAYRTRTPFKRTCRVRLADLRQSDGETHLQERQRHTPKSTRLSSETNPNRASREEQLRLQYYSFLSQRQREFNRLFSEMPYSYDNEAAVSSSGRLGICPISRYPSRQALDIACPNDHSR